MRLYIGIVTVGTVLVFNRPASGARTLPDPDICQGKFGVVERLFPWPAPPPSLINELARRARSIETPEATRHALARALERPAPDFVIKALYPALPNAGRRAGDKKHLTADPARTRETLAECLAAIDDPASQWAWMQFLARDPVANVAIAAARTCLSWEDQQKRDAFVEEAGLSPAERRTRLLAAKSHLTRLSPAVRWRVIQKLVALLHSDSLTSHLKHANPPGASERPAPVVTGTTPDQDVAAALLTFEEPHLLKRWYEDQLGGRTLVNALREGPELSHNMGNARIYLALYAGRALSRINQPHGYFKTIDELTKLAALNDRTGAFAREVLSWESVWHFINDERFNRSIGIVETEEIALRELRLRTLDDRSYKIAQVERQRVLARPFQPVTSWTIEQLRAFTVRLETTD